MDLPISISEQEAKLMEPLEFMGIICHCVVAQLFSKAGEDQAEFERHHGLDVEKRHLQEAVFCHYCKRLVTV